jgi:hypothetical protein
MTNWEVFDTKILIEKDLSGKENLSFSCLQIQKAPVEM